MGHFLQEGRQKSSALYEKASYPETSASPLFDYLGHRKYLTTSERRAFLQAAEALPGPERTFCKTLAYTGARLSEVLALRPINVDYEARLIAIESLKKRRKGMFRAVPIPETLLRELEAVHNIRVRRGDNDHALGPIWTFRRTTAWKVVKAVMEVISLTGENGGAKVYHGSGGIVPLPAE